MDASKNSKLENTILYLLKRSASHRPPMTVLLKMLWFVDYSHYREFLASITGARYVAMKRGPVVDGYRAILDSMESRGLLTQEKEANAYFPDSPPTQYYSAATQPDVSQFSETELDVMENVIAECAHQTGKQLSDLTHGAREPWTLVWDDRAKSPKPIEETVWRWSENLPDESDIALARLDVRRPHVQAALQKLRAAERAETKV